MILIATLVGYLLGSIPTAGMLASLRGIDLRAEGSANPGTNNAIRLGGPILGVLVLLLEMAKGAAATMLGFIAADEFGAVCAGLGAIAGNVYNVWYRFGGGKGLGISAGILAILWPALWLPVIVVIAVAVAATRSSGTAVLITLVFVNVAAVVWAFTDLPTYWGIEEATAFGLFSFGATVLLFPKHWHDSSIRRSRVA